jgi:hypothetical protein
VNPNWRANFDGNTYISNSGGDSGSGGRPMMTGGRTQNYDLWYGVNALDRDGDSADDPIVYTRAQAQSNQSVVSSADNWFADAFPSADVWQSGSPAASLSPASGTVHEPTVGWVLAPTLLVSIAGQRRSRRR